MKKELKEKLAVTIATLKRFKAEDCILIASNPRSGSTWLMELLQHMPKTAIVWEPFHVKQGVLSNKFNLGWRPIVHENKEFPKLKKQVDLIFSSKHISSWTTSKTTVKDLCKAKQLLVKSVRCTGMLKWLVQNFDFTHKPIYLVRHPIPTVLSQLKAFHDKQDAEVTLLKPIETWLQTNSDLHEHLDEKYLTIFYEDLLLNPKDELTKIELAWGKELVRYIPSLRKASATDFQNDLQQNPRMQIEKWINQISEQQKKELQDLFDKYALKTYSAYSAYPIKMQD